MKASLLAVGLALAFCGPLALAKTKAESDGLGGKFIVGYQGWFGCPGDYGGNRDWIHWFKDGVPDEAHLRVEYLPDVSDYPKDALCPTKMKRADGTPINLYSGINPEVVDLHFRWMARYGIDGAAVQRFIGAAEAPRLTVRWDHELRVERAAAEKSGRKFYVTYDISGGNPKTVIADIERDWPHLVNDLHITDSPSYLKDHGKPVLELWGFGVIGHAGGPAEVRTLIETLKSGAEGAPPVTLIGGVAPEWRTLDGSSKTDPAWADVYRSFDVISPWYTGRPKSIADVKAYAKTRVAGDVALTKQLGIGFMPVVYPGFSWSNLQRADGSPNHPLNEIPRLCGDFFWTQIKLMLALHVHSFYGGMFDEVDEGTAMFKILPKPEGLPVGVKMLDLDADGCDLPSDFYLRLGGAAGALLRSGGAVPSNAAQAFPAH